MQAPGRNAPFCSIFLDFVIICVVCLFISCASPLVLFSSLFPFSFPLKVDLLLSRPDAVKSTKPGFSFCDYLIL